MTNRRNLWKGRLERFDAEEETWLLPLGTRHDNRSQLSLREIKSVVSFYLRGPLRRVNRPRDKPRFSTRRKNRGSDRIPLFKKKKSVATTTNETKKEKKIIIRKRSFRSEEDSSRVEKAGSKTEAIDLLLRGNGGEEGTNLDRTAGGGVDTAEEDVKTI